MTTNAPADHRGYCLCCRVERAHLTSLTQMRIQICRVCQLHQGGDLADWIKRDKHHRQMWAGEMAEADGAYMEELLELEREVTRLKGVLKVAGISSVPLDPNAPALARIHELRAQFISDPQTIGSILTDDGFKPPQGNHWNGVMVDKLAGRLAKVC
jgi:hypothetical protein